MLGASQEGTVARYGYQRKSNKGVLQSDETVAQTRMDPRTLGLLAGLFLDFLRL
jgi:hypothetical protein